MDLNYILAREQIELMRARAAAQPAARAAHQGLADLYRARIDTWQQAGADRAEDAA